jgi:hypothetical protein
MAGRGFVKPLWAGLGIACAVLVSAPTPARADDRSVTIIEGVPEPVPSLPLPEDSTAPRGELKADNPAGLTVEILPNADLRVGTEIAFRVATRKPGYLVLVDINAEGRISQIYPNVASLARYQGGSAAGTNLIKPGSQVRVPDIKNPLARFTFRAEPPRGNGVIVAVLSEGPVQIIDLPETPADKAGPQALVDYLGEAIRGLKIARADDPGQFAPGVWSFAAKAYQIR